jgi:hypothetical protein
LLVGQNPGVSTSSQSRNDGQYMMSLRSLLDAEVEDSWERLQALLRTIIPTWPLTGSYFPLAEAGLRLDQIAYCNLVRCRTENNIRPAGLVVSNCIDHFVRWLDCLTPNAVIFIGKWASDRGAHHVRERNIPHLFMNRKRSLSSEARLENREQAVAFIKSIVGE